MINTPQYIIDLHRMLRAEYSDVKYYIHHTEEYCEEDIFNINGIVIELNRIVADDLSGEELDIVFHEIISMYNNLRHQMISAGYTST